MDVSDSWSALDYFYAVAFGFGLLLYGMFMMWLLRTVIGFTYTLLFEKEKIQGILYYAGNKNTPWLIKPFAFIVWLAMSILSLICTVLLGWLIYETASKIVKRIF